MTIQPCEDRVLVEPEEEAKVTPGGIHLPDKGRERPTKGKVVAAGPGTHVAGLGFIENPIKVGAVVFYGSYTGQELTIDGKKYCVLRASDVLATVEG